MPDRVLDERSDRSIAVSYLAVYAASVMLGVLVTYAVIMGLNASSYRVPDGPTGVIVVLALNVLPAIVVGCALFYRAARRLQPVASPLSRHWRRVLPFYLLAILLLGVTAMSIWENPAAGLVAQLFIWPAMTAIGGAIGDWLAWPASRGALAV